jgi:cytosine deaminase
MMVSEKASSGSKPNSDDLILTDLLISAEGTLLENTTDEEVVSVDMRGAMALPCFIDMHTHLDKGHTTARAPNPDGTFMGALSTVGLDRQKYWTADDVFKRADFSIQCAYAHGTKMIRTHIDSFPPQDEISWPVVCRLREKWEPKGVTLQAVCLVTIDQVSRQGQDEHGNNPFVRTADIVQASKGILGMVTFPVDDLEDRLRFFFELATERELSIDLHVDETMDPHSETLRAIALMALELSFDRPITVGHCCSLSTQDVDRAMDTLDLVAKAGIHVVSLPMCNLYLQDRQAHTTPRRRGVTLVQEMVARGINVSFASDNTRDPFYAYGDMDMVEVFREATRVCQLDHDDTYHWIQSVTTNPAKACCPIAPPSTEILNGLVPGAPADLVLFRARTWTEFLARPQSNRIVLRSGVQIERHLPDFSELDDLMMTG